MTDNFDTYTARVLVNLGLDRIFEYVIPPHLKGRVKAGVKVRVPFGAGKAPREAYVVAVAPPSGRGTLKTIDSLCEESPSVPNTLLKLGEWIADYYCCTKEHAMRCLLPSAVRNGKIKSKKETIYYVADPEKAAQYTANAKKNASKRVAAIKALTLRGGKDMAKLVSEGSSRASVNALVKEGLLKKDERTVDRDPMKNAKVIPSKPCTPTPEQAEALKKIFSLCDDEKRSKHVLLLHGITCSGKTEVYLQAIAHVLEKGGDAIVLVPEIALTPQTVTRFKGRFGDMVSVLHSGLTDGERYDEWMKVHTGRVKIAVGARSALFAPFANLKLIVVDEEHEPSYKQSETPRYNARDVAVMRGKMENAVVILGSATPSFESYTNALNGKYVLAEMFKRSDPSIVLPDVRIIDMRMEKDDEGRRPYFSKMLIDGVRDRIRNNEQSIIFLNKRGYARQLICPDCGFVAQCPECSVPYTYHKKTRTLSCHLCASVIPAPECCPQCGSKEIQYRGAGTERIENVSFDVFKGARIARMDSDTMTNPEAYERVLASFHRGETDVLIGTQMIAKGLDFPNVTLVGIVNADLGLYIPDFRAQERSFQLLAQVAGRAGRGFIKGEVMIQTECPENSAIQCASKHDFKAFYDEEAPFRKEMGLPPYSHVIQLHFDGVDPVKVLAEAQKITENVGKAVGNTAEVGEPAPAPVERIKGRYRFVSLVRGSNLALARKVIRLEIMQARARMRDVDFYADVDAVNMM